MGSRDEDGMGIAWRATQLCFLGTRTGLAMILELFPEWELVLRKIQLPHQHCQHCQHSSATSTTSIPLLLEGQ